MYSTELWGEWSQRELRNYKQRSEKRHFLKKGYIHFDHPFWFPERQEEIRTLLLNGLVISKRPNGQQYWSFSPFQKILIKTPRYKYQEEEGYYDLETKIRPISFAAHIDSLILSYYAFALTKKYQEYIHKEGFAHCVLAYRSDLDGKCNIQFAKEVFDYIKLFGKCSAICLDIKGYFDSIDHQLLHSNWATVIGGRLPEDQYRIFKVLSRYSYVNKNSILKKYTTSSDHARKRENYTTLFDLVPGSTIGEKFKQLKSDKLIVTNDKPNKKTGRCAGIPQGSPMSSVLSNIYLATYDKRMSEKARNDGFLYRRYCDDIIIVCKDEIRSELKELAIDLIKNSCFLTIQDKKVETISFFSNSHNQVRAYNAKKLDELNDLKIISSKEKLFYKNLQYLGFEFNGHDVFIRSSSLSRYYRKMKGRIIKTITMAYSGKKHTEKPFHEQLRSKIFKEHLFVKYSHLGKRNFLTYAYNASRKEYVNSAGDKKEGFDSIAIKKQLRRHFAILLSTLKQKNLERFKLKIKKRKASRLKDV